MSVINKVLQDLDARNALPPLDESSATHYVRAVQQASPGGREWFWRALAALALAALAWVGWMAWHLQPRDIVTEVAFAAAAEARSKTARLQTMAEGPKGEPVKAEAPAPAPAGMTQAETAKEEAPVAAPAGEATPPSRRAELKLTDMITTPIVEKPPPARVAEKPKEREKAREKGPASAPAVTATSAPAPAPVADGTARFAKRERPQSGTEEAEGLFRHGVSLLRQRRASEAQEAFYAALARERSHVAARQALVSLLLERREIGEARRLLEEALALDPAQPHLATVLARIHVESGDYRGAAAVLGAAAAGQNDPEFQTMHGAVLQRLGRHPEAAEAFRNATATGNASGATWVALAVSLEAIGRKGEAVQAYRRSLGTPIAQDVRSYAESRIRALD
jgi:MSHA biogenesis protein MshN